MVMPSNVWESMFGAENLSVNLVSDIRLKKNTAFNNFMFRMSDVIDHVSPKTGLTITATRSIDGAAFGACSNSASEVSNGWYKINLSAGDLNGEVVALKFTGTGADQCDITIITQLD